MTCALYMGSFNPLHSGHIAIVKYLLEDSGIDQVRLILSPKNPIKADRLLLNAGQRMEALKKKIEGLISEGELPRDKVAVSDVEFHLPPPLYTIHTLNHLQRQEPETRFILVIGGDNIAIIERWYRWKEILENFEVWVYPRTGTDGQAICDRLNRISPKIRLRYLAGAALHNISSTEIRKKMGLE